MVNSAQKTIGILIAGLLLIPFITMQFTKEVNWSVFDFLIMGFLLLSTGLTCEFLNRKVSNPKIKMAIILGVLILFFLIWAELAVGIFNSPIAGS